MTTNDEIYNDVMAEWKIYISVPRFGTWTVKTRHKVFVISHFSHDNVYHVWKCLRNAAAVGKADFGHQLHYSEAVIHLGSYIESSSCNISFLSSILDHRISSIWTISASQLMNWCTLSGNMIKMLTSCFSSRTGLSRRGRLKNSYMYPLQYLAMNHVICTNCSHHLFIIITFRRKSVAIPYWNFHLCCEYMTDEETKLE